MHLFWFLYFQGYRGFSVSRKPRRCGWVTVTCWTVRWIQTWNLSSAGNKTKSRLSWTRESSHCPAVLSSSVTPQRQTQAFTAAWSTTLGPPRPVKKLKYRYCLVNIPYIHTYSSPILTIISSDQKVANWIMSMFFTHVNSFICNLIFRLIYWLTFKQHFDNRITVNSSKLSHLTKISYYNFLSYKYLITNYNQYFLLGYAS